MSCPIQQRTTNQNEYSIHVEKRNTLLRKLPNGTKLKNLTSFFLHVLLNKQTKKKSSGDKKKPKNLNVVFNHFNENIFIMKM